MDGKKRFHALTIKAIIILKNNFQNYSCNDFYKFLTQSKLLNAFSSLQKFNNDIIECNKNREEQSTSTQ